MNHFSTRPSDIYGRGVSSLELLDRQKQTQNVYITSPAIIVTSLNPVMLFVGETYEKCFEKASQHTDLVVHKQGFLGTDGKFYDPLESGMIAYRNRQTSQLFSPLKPEDIFL